MVVCGVGGGVLGLWFWLNLGFCGGVGLGVALRPPGKMGCSCKTDRTTLTRPTRANLPTRSANSSDQSGWPPPTPLGSGAGQLLVVEATYGESGAGHALWCQTAVGGGSRGGPLEILGCVGEFAPRNIISEHEQKTLLCIFSYITCIYDNILKI